MRIIGIEADNFKLFTTRFQAIKDIEKADLILLNGPNGYGKTSVFDILEFCLTGEIGRINKYTEELAITKNETSEGKILIADESKPAYVKIVLEESGKMIEIKYSYSSQTGKRKASKDNNPHNIFKHFTREILCDGIAIEDQKQIEFLKELKLDDIKEWFDKCCFLSQDEHLQFLKEAKKSKAEAISFLFDVPKRWEKEQERVNEILDVLGSKRNKNHPSYLFTLEEEENKINDKVARLEAVISSGKLIVHDTFQQLYKEKNIFWDQENVLFNNDEYEIAIREIDDLIYFAEHMEDCKKYLFNLPYKKYLKEFDGSKEILFIDHSLEYAYRFYGLVIHEEELEKRYTREKKKRTLLECIQNMDFDSINWEFIGEGEYLSEDKIKDINDKLESVKNLKSVQSILEQTMGSLKRTREDFIRHTKAAIEYKNIQDNVCPLCGASYGNLGELETVINKETEVLNGLSFDSVDKIHSIIDKLYSDYFSEIERKIREELKTPVSEDIYQRLREVKEHKNEILKIQEQLQKLGLFLPNVYEESIPKINRGYNILLNSLKEKLNFISPEFEKQLDDRKFQRMYYRFYDGDEQKFLQITDKTLRSKKNYINSLYFDSSVEALNKLKEKKNLVEARKVQLNKIIESLTKYRDAISEGMQEYKMKIIKDIEPILHVYTAKILQQKFNGKSIFISTDEKIANVSLVNSMDDKQDILYSMSSGQLSAVALAFLLCMNQVYGRRMSCSILLIDDPVQTIDDVNMVGLVDILRYSFADRQIFISTHEQKFEWFLRYRYAKAGKKVKLFNMKDIMLQGS